MFGFSPFGAFQPRFCEAVSVSFGQDLGLTKGMPFGEYLDQCFSAANPSKSRFVRRIE